MGAYWVVFRFKLKLLVKIESFVHGIPQFSNIYVQAVYLLILPYIDVASTIEKPTTWR